MNSEERFVNKYFNKMATLNNVLKAIEALKSTQESNNVLSDLNTRYTNKLFFLFNNN